jgi:hypothetical protein
MPPNTSFLYVLCPLSEGGVKCTFFRFTDDLGCKNFQIVLAILKHFPTLTLWTGIPESEYGLSQQIMTLFEMRRTKSALCEAIPMSARGS